MQGLVSGLFAAILGLLSAYGLVVVGSLGTWVTLRYAVLAAGAGLSLGLWTARSRAAIQEDESKLPVRPIGAAVLSGLCLLFGQAIAGGFFSLLGLGSLSERGPLRKLVGVFFLTFVASVSLFDLSLRYGLIGTQQLIIARGFEAQPVSSEPVPTGLAAERSQLHPNVLKLVDQMTKGFSENSRAVVGLIVRNLNQVVVDESALEPRTFPVPLVRQIEGSDIDVALTDVVSDSELGWVEYAYDTLSQSSPLSVRLPSPLSVERIEQVFRALNSDGFLIVYSTREALRVDALAGSLRQAWRRAGLKDFELSVGLSVHPTGAAQVGSEADALAVVVRKRPFTQDERIALELKDLPVFEQSSSTAVSPALILSENWPIRNGVLKPLEASLERWSFSLLAPLGILALILIRLTSVERRKGQTQWQSLSVLFFLSGLSLVSGFLVSLYPMRSAGAGLGVLAVASFQGFLIYIGTLLGLARAEGEQQRTGLRFHDFVILISTLIFAMLSGSVVSQFVGFFGSAGAILGWVVALLPFGFSLGRILNSTWIDVREKLAPDWLPAVSGLVAFSCFAGFTAGLTILLEGGAAVALTVLFVALAIVIVFGNILRPWFVRRSEHIDTTR